MSDENAPIAGEVSDTQVNEFFDKGGDDAVIAPEAPEKPAGQTSEPPKEEEAPEKKYVPLEALHEQRRKTKELKEELEGMRRKFDEILEASKPKPQEVQAPAVDVDPVGHFQAENARIQRELNELKGLTKEQRQAAQQQQQWNTFVGAYQNSAAQFAKETTDFNQAYQHAIASRIQSFIAAGFSPEQADATAKQEEVAIVTKAFQDGENPAARIYAWSKALGYKQAAPKQPAEAKIDTLAKGTAATSLAQAGGKAPDPDSWEAIAVIEDDDEFDKAWARMEKKSGRG